MKYCTYARFKGIIGWFMGWYLVGIAEQPIFGGYSADFASMGCHLMLIELDAPLPYKFYFLPKGAKIIQRR